MRVDLHIHSTASDGRWHPAQIVREVREAGIDLFAVADHDTTANLAAVQAAVHGSGLGFVQAIEISTTVEGRGFHVIGYGIDPEHPALQHVLADNRAQMEDVDLQSIRKLIAAGYDFSFQDYKEYQDDPLRGGWKALNLFIDKGFCSDVHDFFGRLFTGDLALDMPDFVATEEAIRVIHDAGGLAICAHAAHSAGQEMTRLDQLVKEGLDGLECYSPYHDPATVQRLVAYCRHRDLLITAGSDCHGGFVGRRLGLPVAYASDLKLGPLLDHVIR